ncbi:MAG: periplasmic heavy metal sensor [Thermoanaerobaculia bacterium]|nr:periplasmic heavy metal sensor [Thermoanaerobaculia bacterium]
MRKAALFWGLFAILLLSIGLNVGLFLGQVRSPVGSGTEVTAGETVSSTPREPIRPRPPSAEGPRRLGERLGLSGEELEEFTAIQRQFLSRVTATRRERERIRRELRYELTAPEPDREAIESLIEDAARLATRMDRALAEHVLASRDLLEGEAETRYLRHLARLGPRRTAPGPRRPPRRPP